MMMKKNAKMIFSTIILIFMFVLAGSVVVMASTDDASDESATNDQSSVVGENDTNDVVDEAANEQGDITDESTESGILAKASSNEYDPKGTYASLKVNKIWSDGNENHADDNIWVYLYKNGSWYDYTELNAENDWTYEWEKLWTNPDNKDVTFTISEVEVSGYATKYTSGNKDIDNIWDFKIGGNDNAEITINNIKVDGYDPADPYMDLAVEKKWLDADGNLLSPEDCKDFKPILVNLINVTLGKVVDTVELSSENDWTYEWNELCTRYGQVYKVEEVDVPDGYTVDYSEQKRVNPDDENSNKDGYNWGKNSYWDYDSYEEVNYDVVNKVTITNKQLTFGSLKISKEVTGNQGDVNREFNFTVALTDANGNALDGSYAYTGSKEGTIANGGKVTLKSGESVTIADLPVGTKYVVTEDEANQDGYTTSVIGGEGVIAKDAESLAAFNNHKSVHKPSKPSKPSEPSEPDDPQVDTVVDEPVIEIDDPDTPLDNMIIDPIDVPLGNYMTALQDQPSQQIDNAHDATKDATPNTGDNTATVAWAMLLVCSLMGMGVLLAKKR